MFIYLCVSIYHYVTLHYVLFMCLSLSLECYLNAKKKKMFLFTSAFPMPATQWGLNIQALGEQIYSLHNKEISDTWANLP